jgi:lysophospholipase L1-like esterase
VGRVAAVQTWLVVSLVVHLVVLGVGGVYLYKTRHLLKRWYARRRSGAAKAHSPAPRLPFYEMRLATFQVLREESSNRPAVLFAGDSLTNAFEWAEFFPHDRDTLVINRGVSGVGVEFLVDHFEAFFVPGYAVKQVFLMIGINDIRAPIFELDPFVRAYDTLLERLLTHFAPDAIYVQSLLPVRVDGIPQTRIPAVNERIRSLAEAKGAHYIDLFRTLADAEGFLDDKYTLGGVHLSAQGYRRWMDALRPYLAPGPGA